MNDINSNSEPQKSISGRISTTWSNFWNTRKKEILLVIIIFLVASLSFGLGYLANREFNHSPIIIQNNPENQ